MVNGLGVVKFSDYAFCGCLDDGMAEGVSGLLIYFGVGGVVMFEVGKAGKVFPELAVDMVEGDE